METKFGDLKNLDSFTTGWNSDTYRKVIPQYSARMGFCEACMLMKTANCINNRTSEPDHLCEDAVVFSQSKGKVKSQTEGRIVKEKYKLLSLLGEYVVHCGEYASALPPEEWSDRVKEAVKNRGRLK